MVWLFVLQTKLKITLSVLCDSNILHTHMMKNVFIRAFFTFMTLYTQDWKFIRSNVPFQQIESRTASQISCTAGLAWQRFYVYSLKSFPDWKKFSRSQKKSQQLLRHLTLFDCKNFAKKNFVRNSRIRRKIFKKSFTGHFLEQSSQTNQIEHFCVILDVTSNTIFVAFPPNWPKIQNKSKRYPKVSNFSIYNFFCMLK